MPVFLARGQKLGGDPAALTLQGAGGDTQRSSEQRGSGTTVAPLEENEFATGEFVRGTSSLQVLLDRSRSGGSLEVVIEDLSADARAVSGEVVRA